MTEGRIILGEVPFFPLPGVTLFPGALLPLHIYEPRYRKMTEDVLASNRLMCVVQLKRGEAVDEPMPEAFEIAGLGEIVDSERLPDGRFNLLLRGRARVRLDELPFRAPYRRARAFALVETPGSATLDLRTLLFSAARTGLVKLQKRYPGAELQLDPELVHDTATQQRLLETLDVSLRAQLCVEELLRQGVAGAAN
jgi:Lon protease-like protein